MGTLLDHYEGEDVILTFEEEGQDTVTNYEGKVLKMSISGGAASTEDIFAFGSKTFNIQKPKEKFTISMDVIFSDTRFAQMHFGGRGAVNTEIRSSSNPSRWRIIAWFVAAANHKTSGTVVVPPKTGAMMRYIFTDCKAVTFDEEFSADDTLKGTITFELSATDSNGYANLFKEATASYGTTALTTLNTTAHKGILTWTTTTTIAWTGSYRT